LNKAGLRRSNGNVTGHGNGSAGAGSHTIDSGNDRHAQRLDSACCGIEGLLNDGARVSALNGIGA
jgi:hypothetical protein